VQVKASYGKLWLFSKHFILGSTKKRFMVALDMRIVKFLWTNKSWHVFMMIGIWFWIGIENSIPIIYIVHFFYVTSRECQGYACVFVPNNLLLFCDRLLEP